MASREKTNWWNREYAGDFSKLNGYLNNKLRDTEFDNFNDGIIDSCSSDTLMVGGKNVFEELTKSLFDVVKSYKSITDQYLLDVAAARSGILDCMKTDEGAANVADRAYDNVVNEPLGNFRPSSSLAAIDNDETSGEGVTISTAELAANREAAAVTARESTWEAENCDLW